MQVSVLALIPEWHFRAACGQVDPDLMFPQTHIRTRKAQAAIEAAKAVCARCPVRQECLDFAVTTGQSDGVWGGLTPKERWQIGQYRLCARCTMQYHPIRNSQKYCGDGCRTEAHRATKARSQALRSRRRAA